MSLACHDDRERRSDVLSITVLAHYIIHRRYDMRSLLALVASTLILVGCAGGAGDAVMNGGQQDCVPQTVVTKTGVVETCI